MNAESGSQIEKESKKKKDESWIPRQLFKEMAFGDVLEVFKSTDNEVVNKAFTREQKQILTDLFSGLFGDLEWHRRQEKPPHENTLMDEISNIDAKLRNHRHDLNKKVSGKAEF